jgi:GT2 family glycosyltransferase
MELSIVIVNWNSTDFTIGCIQSIQSTTSELAYEIIVVDNASADDSWRTIPAKFPGAKLVRSDRNLGFARANNLGVEHAEASKILFLNPDTVVLHDAISQMSKLLDSSPDIGVLGCRLLNRDLSLQTTCVQPFPTISNQILTIDWLKRRWPKLELWGMRALFSEDSTEVCEVQVVCGACLMVKRSVFEKVGGFSTEYFMYAEEMDLCHKIRDAGWKVCHARSAQVLHFGGQSTKKRGDSFSHIVMRESVYRLLRKFRGTRYAQLYRMAVFISAVIRLSVLLLLRVVPDGLVDRTNVVWALRKWSKVASWCLALEGWTQELGATSQNGMMVKN